MDLSKIPSKPGVYKFKNKVGEVIYVGASKNLNKRVKSYFLNSNLNNKTNKLVKEITYIEFEIIISGNQAFLRERELINLHKPKFNIRWLDDKQYPYLSITISESYPRIIIARNKKQGGDLYFEKQAHVKPLRKSLKQLRKIFPICDCYRPVKPNKKKRPCLNYDMNLCPAPCTNRISEEKYMENVDNLVNFLQGDALKVIEKWETQMNAASNQLEFEKASRFRNQINALKNLSVHSKREIEGFFDVVGYYESASQLCLIILSIKDEQLKQKSEYFLHHDSYLHLDEILLSGIKKHYLNGKSFPNLILFPKLIQDIEFFFEWLNEESTRDTKFQIMSNITKNKWIQKAKQEAKKSLNRNFDNKEVTINNYEMIDSELRNLLNIKSSVSLIECIDISTFQGRHTVGSIVAFKNGAAEKSYYRRYKIKTLQTPNDPGSMFEVLTRHFKRKGTDKLDLPDLLLVDGGKSQLSAVNKTFNKLKLAIPYVGIAKKEEELIIPGKRDSIKLDHTSKLLQLLVSLRDEAHRFAITYHKTLRKKSNFENEIENIHGIGPKKRLALIKEFKTINKIKKASFNDLVSIKNISNADAHKIISFFKSEH